MPSGGRASHRPATDTSVAGPHANLSGAAPSAFGSSASLVPSRSLSARALSGRVNNSAAGQNAFGQLALGDELLECSVYFFSCLAVPVSLEPPIDDVVEFEATPFEMSSYLKRNRFQLWVIVAHHIQLSPAFTATS